MIPAADCTHLTTDLSVPVSIQFSALSFPFVEVGDTLRLHVVVLDRAGDTVPGAAVRLAVVDTAFLRLDSADFAVIGRDTTVAARIVALAGALRSDTFSLAVPPGHADSLAPVSAVRDSLAAADTVSDSLSVQVLDLTATPGTPTPLARRAVRFSIVQPVFPRVDTATVHLPNDSLGQTVATDATGLAVVRVWRRSTAHPDSAVVQAVATHSSGAALRGSPVRFVVRFQ